jgi:hypothetical protein
MNWLSLGENCLSDAILHRHGIKTTASPFSHGRSNVEYATQADATNFKGFLHRRNLEPGFANGKPVLRSRLYTSTPGLFRRSCSQGFEITHHDPIKNADHRRSFERKISRWISIRDSDDDVAFLYHHRATGSDADISRVVEKLDLFARQYSRARQRRCFVLCIVQNLIPAESHRAYCIEELAERIWTARIDSYEAWSGGGPQFWALNDDDLIGDVLRAARALFACQALFAA